MAYTSCCLYLFDVHSFAENKPLYIILKLINYNELQIEIPVPKTFATISALKYKEMHLK